ncbi:MAG: prolipoprotein diacylglyceryl transferase [Bacillota bacterium]
MRPVLFEIGPLAVYSWGFFLDLAVVAGVLVTIAEGRRRRLPAVEVLNLSFVAAVAGFVGARLLYVLVEWPAYRADPLSAFSVFEGGLSGYGALLGGAAAVLWTARRRGRPALFYLDVMAPGMALGLAIGRVGCTLRGCCYGLPTTAPWGIASTLADGLRFPAQPLEAALDLASFGWLMLPAWRGASRSRPALGRGARRGAPDGRRFFVYLASYAAVRFATDFVREAEYLWGWLTVTQAFSLAVFGLSLVALAYLARLGRSEPTAGRGIARRASQRL